MKLNTGENTAPNGHRVRINHLIVAAAILHMSVAITVFAVGKLRLMPSQFNEQGLANFAPDGLTYANETVQLRNILRERGLIAWATWPSQLHLRLYSLPLVAADAFSVVAIEPLNLIYYLSILLLVYRLGETVFCARSGILAAAVVALWPSFLLHTTQLLRDPLLICAFLVLMFSLSHYLQNRYTWQRGTLSGIASALAMVAIRIVRLPLWGPACAIVLLAALFLIARFWREGRVASGNICLAAILIATIVIVPKFQPWFRDQQAVRVEQSIIPEQVQALSLPEQIAQRRRAFEIQVINGNRIESNAGSLIDAEVQFHTIEDIVRFLPRAAEIGFFAPFPYMWLTPGKQVGFSGRLLSGFETSLTYLIECLALIAVWTKRKQLTVWLLSFMILIGAIALGLIVVNIGSLYRLRYPFWILLVVLGAGGALQVIGRWTRLESTHPETDQCGVEI